MGSEITKFIFRDKDWLHQKYVVERLSAAQIAREYREMFPRKWCEATTILRWLKNVGITVRSLKEAQQNRHKRG